MTRTVVAPDIAAVLRVDKPWGHEEIFAIAEGRYVGKVLHVRADHSLSLQYHREKEETVAVQAGRVRLEIGPSSTDLVAAELVAGQSVHIPPNVLHRITAISDAVLLEASTAGQSWREDVVRLEDCYGRADTTAP
ncbi:cupin domain-containing protein [Saccharopolyspora sp. NPDC002376]